ncbi:MAG: hypothetical protein VX577_07495, partial [Verrucomicrobiota bacterium]|nr:hypothetical protein [Verrucomicrobiota bacterium]
MQLQKLVKVKKLRKRAIQKILKAFPALADRKEDLRLEDLSTDQKMDRKLEDHNADHNADRKEDL